MHLVQAKQRSARRSLHGTVGLGISHSSISRQCNWKFESAVAMLLGVVNKLVLEALLSSIVEIGSLDNHCIKSGSWVGCRSRSATG